MDENTARTPLMKNREELHAMLPRAWIGYVIAGIYLGSEFLPFPVKTDDGVSILPLLVGLAGSIYWLICVFQVHRTLVEMADHKYRNGPWKAVLFHLIPIYSIYWIFKWPNDAADFLLSINGRLKMPKNVVGLIFLAGVMLARFLDGGLGLAAIFSGLLYLTRQIEKTIEAG